MKTKAELEAEVNDLTVRVAELEGEVAGYRYALTQVNRPEPAPAPYYRDPMWTWPNTFTVSTSPVLPGVSYNSDTTN